MSEPRLYPGQGPEERTTFAPYSAFDIPADLRELHGRYDVEATARRIRNFRYAEEWMMLAMGGWLATIPELPVKTGLGKVIWETAQTADAFGRRLPELRCGRMAVAASESSNHAFAEFVQAARPWPALLLSAARRAPTRSPGCAVPRPRSRPRLARAARTSRARSSSRGPPARAR